LGTNLKQIGQALTKWGSRFMIPIAIAKKRTQSQGGDGKQYC